jgi:hypothetical protein
LRSGTQKRVKTAEFFLDKISVYLFIFHLIKIEENAIVDSFFLKKAAR